MFWNNTKDNTANVSEQKYYLPYASNMRPTNDDGYNCDTLASSPVIFLGSCDMSGPIPNSSLVWSRVMHRQFTSTLGDFPYIGLSRMHCGMHSVIRRISSYCEKFGPPKNMFLVMPRPVCIEIPIRGVLVNVAERNQYVDWLCTEGLITSDELETCMKAVTFARSQQDNQDYQLYQFEQAANSLYLLCKAYGIKFSWTPNLAVAATIYYPRWMEMFLANSPFMARTCAGVGKILDFAIDASTGQKTQASLVNVFQDSSENNSLADIMEQLQANKNHLMTVYPNAYNHAMKLANPDYV